MRTKTKIANALAALKGMTPKQLRERYAELYGEPSRSGQRFDDEGQSGSTLERPAMRKLRKVVDLDGIDRIYAVALDRVTRSMRDAVVLLDEFEKAGVDVHFVHQPELTFGAQGRFLRHVLAAFAEFERDMIATASCVTPTTATSTCSPGVRASGCLSDWSDTSVIGCV